MCLPAIFRYQSACKANVGGLEYVRVLGLGTGEMKQRKTTWQYTYLARPAGNETYQNWYVPED